MKISLMILLALVIPIVPTAAHAVKLTISGTGITTQSFSNTTASGTQTCVFLLNQNPSLGANFTVTNLGIGARGCIDKGSTTQMFTKGFRIGTTSSAPCSSSSPCTFTITVETQAADATDVTAGLLYTYGATLNATSTAPLGQDARQNIVTLTARANTLSSTGLALTGTLINKLNTQKTTSVDYSINCGPGTLSSTNVSGWDTTSTSTTANCNKATSSTLETLNITCPSTGVVCHSIKLTTVLKFKGKGHFFELKDSADMAAANVSGAYGAALVNQALESYGGFFSVPAEDQLFANFLTPLAGSNAGGGSSVPIKAELLFVNEVRPTTVEFRSILSNNLVSDDQSAVIIPFAPGTTRVEDLYHLTAYYSFTVPLAPPEGDCAKSWRWAVTLERLPTVPMEGQIGQFREPRIYFDLGETFDATLGGYRGCTQSFFDSVNVITLKNDPRWDLTEIGEGTDLTLQQMLAKVGKDNVKLVALGLSPRPDFANIPEGAFDQRVAVSKVEVQDKTFVPVESVSFALLSCDTLPRSGVFFRITQLAPVTGFSFDVPEGSKKDQVSIVSCRYQANVAIASLNGPGTYKIQLHHEDKEFPVAGETIFTAN